ncbi:cyclophilin-like fold protein [Schaalia sp. ZJ1691]|uniref:cyclophilin-like fold protein n=1 Tax=Schaalia sp. ZJ1691 TaxID=2709404 RepID=UPI0013EBD139|nr:cyclophilin-like fold protein [Schaalia sp. ZJ1691]
MKKHAVDHPSGSAPWRIHLSMVLVAVATILLPGCGGTQPELPLSEEPQLHAPQSMPSQQSGRVPDQKKGPEDGQSPQPLTGDNEETTIRSGDNMRETLVMTANGQELLVDWEDNDSVRNLAALVAQSPVTVELTPYGGFELVGDLPWSVTSNDRALAATSGDILLYQSRSLVVMLGENQWSYTRLGRLRPQSLEVLGSMGPGVPSAGASLVVQLSARA